MGAGDVDSYALPPPPPPPEPHLDSSLAGLPSTAQFHAIDWSYLNFPICKSGSPLGFIPSSQCWFLSMSPKI
jgi:hypothetical protein